jgi:hypothetical protein
MGCVVVLGGQSATLNHPRVPAAARRCRSGAPRAQRAAGSIAATVRARSTWSGSAQRVRIEVGAEREVEWRGRVRSGVARVGVDTRRPRHDEGRTGKSKLLHAAVLV